MKFAPRSLAFAVFTALLSLLFSAGAQAAPVPDGSYLASCKNVRATSRVLTAQCQTRRGGYIETRLAAYRDCRGDIANDNGRLICREPDLTLYEHSRFRGRALFVDNDLAQMPRSFNDRASSIRVRRGMWQICVDWNYGGRCVTVNADVSDLTRLGMNDRISSVRRIVPPPQGSYLQTCREVQFDGRTLTASCRKRFNRYETSSLDVRRCPRGADIANDNGELSCDGDDDRDDRVPPDRGGPGRGDDDRDDATPPPGGSYLKTCRNVRADDDRLFAECQDRNGNWRRTDLDYSDCPGEIRNENGRLDCGASVPPPPLPPGPPPPPQGGPRPNGLPPGSYRQSCRDLSIMGGTLTGECKARNGVWRTTALILRTCSPGTDISNENGVLVCTSVPFVPSSAPPPPTAGTPPVPPAPPGGVTQPLPNANMPPPTAWTPPPPVTGTPPTSNVNTPPPTAGTPPAPPASNVNAPPPTAGTPPPPASNVSTPPPTPPGGTTPPSTGTPPTGGTPPTTGTPPTAGTPPSGGEGPSHGGVRQPPEGSYQQSCRNFAVERGTLKAECKDGGGAWQPTSLSMRECRNPQDISNDNGVLKCVAPAGGTP